MLEPETAPRALWDSPWLPCPSQALGSGAPKGTSTRPPSSSLSRGSSARPSPRLNTRLVGSRGFECAGLVAWNESQAVPRVDGHVSPHAASQGQVLLVEQVPPEMPAAQRGDLTAVRKRLFSVIPLGPASR